MNFEKLGDIISISKGKKHKLAVSGEKSFRYIQIDDLRNDSNLKYTEETGVEVDVKDLIIAWDGANAGTVGFGLKGMIGSTLARLRIKAGKYYSTEYIGYLLQRNFDHLRSKTTGTTIPHIDRRTLESLKIPAFEYNVQQQIAFVLTNANALVKQRNRSIHLLDDFLKSTFLKMFYSNRDVDNWSEVTFESLAAKHKGSIRTGPFGSSLLHSEFTETGDVRVLGIDNVVNNRFEWKRNRNIPFEKFQELKQFQVFPDDVLISIMATIGKTAVVPANIPTSINSKHLAAITLDREIANPYFVSYAFHSHPDVLRQIDSSKKGAIMNGLNLPIIRRIKLNLPPILLQSQFETILKKINTIREQLNANLFELENLFDSLSQRAFNGGLELKNLVVQYELEYETSDNDRTEPKQIDFNKLSLKVKERKGDKHYGDPFEVDEETAKTRGKRFYKEWKRLHDERIMKQNLDKAMEYAIHPERIPKVEKVEEFNWDSPDLEHFAYAGPAKEKGFETMANEALREIATKKPMGFTFQDFVKYLKESKGLDNYQESKKHIFNLLDKAKLLQEFATPEFNSNGGDNLQDASIWLICVKPVVSK